MKIESEVMKSADSIANKLTDTKEYKDYMEALKYIQERPELMEKVKHLKNMHMNYAYYKSMNTATFEDEKFAAQEFYKLMLDKQVENYFMIENEFVTLLSEIFCRISHKVFLNVFTDN
jgi:cell fate (sporulation/competence/biofilm development) regulator YmcA (YheA/YmcA/DUF963 family)